MKKPFETAGPDELRSAIMGLGARSMRKSYFPELQHRLFELHRFRALLDESSDVILLIRVADRIIVDGNRAAWTLAGRSGESLAGKPVSEFCPSLAERLVASPVSTSAVVCRGHGHEAVPLELVIREVLFEEERFLVVVARDVTERQRAEEELRRAKDAAEAANRDKSEFLNLAAHELRSPLTTLMIVLRLLRTREAGGRSLDPGLLARLERQVRRLADLANDLVDDLRLEQGTLTLRRETVDLGALIEETVDRRRTEWPEDARWDRGGAASPEFAATAGARAARIELVRPPAPVRVSADPVRLAQVLDELLDNAERYATPGAPVQVRLQATDAEAYVEVADQGPGLGPEDRERVFERLARGRPEASRTQPGLGLGLHLARRLVELHGGRIGVESAPGHGSRFWFVLPRGT